MFSNLLKKEEQIMKKMVLLLSSISIALLLITGCLVSSTSCKITIQNRTNTAYTNVKIGDTIIALYVAPGVQIDYWGTPAGEVSATGYFEPYNDRTYTVNAANGWWIYITFSRKNYINEMHVGATFQNDHDKSNNGIVEY